MSQEVGPADSTAKDGPKKSELKSEESRPDAKKEFGGRDGPEPTRYGDWEKKGIISDF